MRNGYFRLVGNGEIFGVELKMPTDGGEQIRIGEVTDYLSKRNITCDVSALKNAISSGKDTVVPLGMGSCPAENMTYKLSVEDDGMKAVARFVAPSQNGQKLTVSEFIDELSRRQITYGIKEDRIREAFENDEYGTDITVAEGTPARHGADAVIEYYFNTDLKARPTLKEDGSVDFFNLNTINHCKEGDVLAKLIPADPGEYGMNITGAKIKPREIKNAVLKYGKNIEISEDKTTLTSLVNGHVTLVEDRVFVSNVLQLENVDISTGNIEYEGSVNVSGNVASNFSIKCNGNIIVDGMVEGAFLEASGDIIIARGMAGMSKGELKAGGNIVAKFLESTRATAGGYISSESILHSTIMAGGDVTVDGRKGFISGGRVCATNLVEVKTLGSHMGTATVIEVGADPEVKTRFMQTQKDIAELTKIIKSLDPIIASYLLKRKQGVQLTKDQMQYLTGILKLRETKVPELEKANKELEILQDMMEMQSHAQVVVKGEVFPGVRIVIGDVSMVVQSSMQYCKFIKQRGDVKMTGI